MLPLALLVCAAEPPVLPPPNATPSVRNPAKVVGWPAGKTPTAPPGFAVTRFADKLDSPRWLTVLPNGDVLLTEGKNAANSWLNTVTLLRDADKDGAAEVKTAFAKGLNRPFGVALLGEKIFIANTDSVLAFPYTPGATELPGNGLKVADLPAGGYNNHWTRNLLPSRDGKKLYVTVGSGSNVAENGTANEILRAAVLEMNPDGTALRVFANGLRNPVGLAFEPTTGVLWTAVNERDNLGDDLVPDYMTSVLEGKFYGWPYSYFGANEDPRLKGQRPDLVAKAVVPDVPLGAHTASLGLAFLTGDKVPAKYRGGAVVGQRGSWNRSQLAGYKVVFVPFADGKPSGPPEDFLAGFVKNEKEVYGRPVGVAQAADGSVLVADETAGIIWRVSPEAGAK